MEIGVFDHLDRYDVPLQEYYEARLQLIEAYDRAGFYSYHVAEHHSTPIGTAPSPSVFLAAVAQRTKRLRFGPMVFALPLYHPLRMIEEICMLDQLSGGRLDMGFGRGSSPYELRYYGENPEESQQVYEESLELILAGLTQKTLNFEGKRFRFKDVPMELEPLQKPYPPIWYGLHAPESAERAARRGLHVVCLDPAPDTKAAIDRFVSVWREVRRNEKLPMIGLGRFVVVAETEAEALRLARRAYPKWFDSFTFLMRRHGTGQQRHPRPPDFDRLAKVGQGVAGTPDQVAAFLKAQLHETGANYCVGQFAFGDLTLPETLSSLDLFVRKVVPALQD
jgi:alkanesulfonate monooxygenase SsuD/methylene tetrahydromethanopterin reductase-like flavin-dependent oxidoreductase (luciferase family)